MIKNEHMVDEISTPFTLDNASYWIDKGKISDFG